MDLAILYAYKRWMHLKMKIIDPRFRKRKNESHYLVCLYKESVIHECWSL